MFVARVRLPCGTPVTSIAYDRWDHPISLSFANGTVETRSYSATRGWQERVQVKEAAGPTCSAPNGRGCFQMPQQDRHLTDDPLNHGSRPRRGRGPAPDGPAPRLQPAGVGTGRAITSQVTLSPCCWV